MEEGKKKGKFKITLLIILSLIVIGVGVFFLYNKVLKDKTVTEENNNNKDNINNRETKDNEEIIVDDYFEVDEGYYLGYYYADENEETPEDGYFFIQCVVGNECKSIAKLGYEVEPIGLYKDRYYYQYSEGKTVYVNYIDFNDNNKINKWFNYDTDEWEENENTAFMINAIFDDNKIIFNLERNIAGHSNLDGILSIDLSAKSITDSKILDKYGTDFVYDKENKILYYEFFDNINNGDDPDAEPFNSIKKYDIKTGKVEKLFDVEYEADAYLFFVQGHLLLGSVNDEKIYDVDLNTAKKNEFLDIKIKEYQSLDLMFNVFNDTLYILKEDGFYTYDFNNNKYEKLIGFDVTDEFLIFDYYNPDFFFLESEKEGKSFFLYKGKRFSELPNIKVDVDGEKLNFMVDYMNKIEINK